MKNNGIEIAEMVKKFIKYRNKTIRMTAQELGIQYTTFHAQLTQGTLRADTLFRLAAYLDIDLKWMMAALHYYGSTGIFEGEIVPRMQPSFRQKEQDMILPRLDDHIRQYLGDTKVIRQELLKDYGGRDNPFYLLDVLIPEEYNILYRKERQNEKKEDKIIFYVISNEQERTSAMPTMSRRSTRRLIDANEALDIIIEDRKEIIL